MKTKLLFLFIVSFSVLFVVEAYAAPFLILGPRALGMGGAQVAVVDDSTAVYWNPAALASYGEIEFNLPVSVMLREQNDLIDRIDEIDDILGDFDLDDPEIYQSIPKVADLIDVFRKLDQEGTGLSADLNVSSILSKGNLAFGILELAYLDASVTMDLQRINIAPLADPNSIANNTSEISVLGLENREFIISYARETGGLLTGGNVKYIYGRTYYKSVSVASESADIDEDLDEMSDSAFSIDAGLLYAFPGTKLKAGALLRNINSPSFSYQDGEIEQEPQFRAGVGYELSEDLLIACDLDLVENETLQSGFDSRMLSLGIEKKLFSDKFALRGGVYNNLSESTADPVFTGGVGFHSSKFKLDIGAGLGSDEAALSLSLSAIF